MPAPYREDVFVLTLTTTVVGLITAAMLPLVALSALVLTPFSDGLARIQMAGTYATYLLATMWIVAEVSA